MLALLALPAAQISLDGILQNPKLEGASVSAYVCTLDGTELFTKAPGLHVVPASNQKLLSGAFALHALGREYRPITKFWKMRNRTVIETSGDPLLTYAELVQMRDRLGLDRRLPVHLKQPFAPMVPPTWEFDDLPNKYAAPITAFSVDRGSFELWHRAGRVALEPTSYGVRIEAKRGNGPLEVAYDPIARIVRVNGKWPEKDQRLDTLAVWQPDRAAGLLLGREVKATDESITVTPDGTITGKNLGEILAACLAPSDNNVAEKLLLLGAGTQGGLPENPYPVARQRMKNFLNRIVGVGLDDVKPYDGSGMSRHNYVTTRSLGRLLRWCNEQPTAELWKSALASPGKGTLANRLKDVPFAGKTGTLDMVTALSGYVRHRTGQELIASVILNQYSCTATEAREVVDSFVRQVAVMDLPAREGE